jgi:DNA polymerase (family 10)
MEYQQALEIATRVLAQLQPHCDRIEIAGSIRRKKPEVKDIEIVAIPKPYDTGLFSSGIATVVNQWPKVKGELPCKYTQRILPEGVKLDLFLVQKEVWGLQLAIRTGSAEYSHKVLASGWVSKGYHCEGAWLYKNGRAIACPEEKDLFRIIGIDYVEPENRNL